MARTSIQAFALLAGALAIGSGSAHAATCGNNGPRAAAYNRVVASATAVRAPRVATHRAARITRAAVVRSAPALPDLRPIVSAPASAPASFSASGFGGVVGSGDGGGGGGGGGGSGM